MNRDETISQLCSEVAGRIAKYHSKPESIHITLEEMEDLYEVYPALLILEAMRRVADVLKNNNKMKRQGMLRALQNLTERLLQKSHVLGKHMAFNGRAQPTQEATQEPKVTTKGDVELLLMAYQANIADDSTWSMSDQTAEALLAQYGLKTLREAMLGMPRSSTENAQDSYDLLAWRAEQLVLQVA